MFIKSIIWIDEKEKEAEVVVSDGVFEILCFSHPFTMKDNEIWDGPLNSLDVENIVYSENQNQFVKKDNNSAFGYTICGKFMGGEDNRVLIGDINISLEDAYIPSDILKGDFIEFNVMRFSIY